jgi:ABC-2 type transport system permease protein
MRVFGIAGVSLRRFLRSKENIFFVFGFPVLIILFIGLQFGGGVVSVLGVVGDASTLRDEIVAETEAVGFAVEMLDDAEAARQWVEKGWAQAAVIVPADDPFDGPVVVDFIAREGFGYELLAPVDAAVARESQAPTVASAIVATTGADADRVEADVEAATVDPTGVETTLGGDGPLFGEGEIGAFDIGASSQLVLFTFLTSLSTSGYLILTRKLGVARRMLASPTRVGAIVAGETLGRYGIALVQALFIVFLTGLLFGVDWGDPIGAAALVGLFALVSTATGMLLGSLMQNDQAAGGIGVMLGIGLGALGGCMIPYEFFGETLQQISRFTPHNWALQGFRELLFRDGTLADITTQLAVLGAMAVVLLGVSVWAYRRSIVVR